MRLKTIVVAAWLTGVAGIVPALAQEAPIDVKKPQATRAELTSALSNLDQTVASPAYSKSLRKTKEAEAQLVRMRLAEGDFQVGDQIDVAVVNEPTLTNKFTVLSDRMLSFPQLPLISLKGVLRSEVRDYLTQEIGKYVKTPQVTIQGSYIRLAILGAVGKPGYYTVPADQLVSDAIMAAGGPAGQPEMNKSVVRRNGHEVVPEGGVELAIQQGQSLDQMNLHGGDELVLAGKGGNSNNPNGGGIRNWLWPIQGALSLALLLWRVL